jgi:YesN/AraC family two-component response regulator
LSIRVVVADDHALVRAGFKMIIDAEPDIEVVAEAEDGQQAVEAARDSEADVVLMDIQMPILNGIGATRRLARGRRGRFGC